MRFVVTGGAGFVGSHLVKFLVKKGHDVIVIDNLVNGYDNLETSTRNHYQHLHHENETNLDKLKTSYDEVRKLRDENRILSAKLDILNAGLKHSTKYSQFIQTVNNLLR